MSKLLGNPHFLYSIVLVIGLIFGNDAMGRLIVFSIGLFLGASAILYTKLARDVQTRQDFISQIKRELNEKA